MQTTIDGAGRIVIPKALRDAAGLRPGVTLDVELRDGRIEISPAGVPMRVAGRGAGAVVQAEGAVPPLTAADVREALERVRR